MAGPPGGRRDEVQAVVPRAYFLNIQVLPAPQGIGPWVLMVVLFLAASPVSLGGGLALLRNRRGHPLATWLLARLP